MKYRLPKPGARKAALLSMTPHCTLAAEIGADHGITSAHIITDGIADRLIVSDISAASLDKARRLFSFHGIEAKAEFRVADGLDAIDQPVDAVLIAGMGGHTIVDILDRGLPRIGDASLILQANTDTPLLRSWLMAHGFTIEDEVIACEDRRYYIVLRAARGEATYTPKELALGPCLLAKPDPLLRPYLQWRHDCLMEVRSEDAVETIAWIEEELR